MSSETSTETPAVRLKPDTTSPRGDSGLEPWQFFVLAALGCATAALFASRGQGLTVVVLLTVLMAATALVGLAALRTVGPLVTPKADQTPMIGRRTRAALEREKMLALRAIKELEFDRAMGKLSETDWQEMSRRLRARAARLMRQLDAGADYREQIERDLSKRLGQVPQSPQDPADIRGAVPMSMADEDDVRTARPVDPPVCVSCATVNDMDARFCKECGQKL